MAYNIDSELRVISTGVYGRDIRGSIHDAIEKTAEQINEYCVIKIVVMTQEEYNNEQNHDPNSLYILYGGS